MVYNIFKCYVAERNDIYEAYRKRTRGQGDTARRRGKKPEKMKKKLSKNYKRINGALSGVTDKAALKWLEKDVKAHPDKYTKRDKGIHIDPAEIIDI